MPEGPTRPQPLTARPWTRSRTTSARGPIWGRFFFETLVSLFWIDEKKTTCSQPSIFFFLSKHRIASANLGDYLASSRYYARALALNPRASSVWGYLRTSLACAGRADLLEAADAEDAAAIERALPL